MYILKQESYLRASIFNFKPKKFIMKTVYKSNVRKIAVSLLGLWLMSESACTNLQVKPADQFTVEQFFKNEKEAESGLASAYAGLRGFFDIYSNGGIYSINEYQGGNMLTPIKNGFDWGDANNAHQRLYELKMDYSDKYYETNTWNWIYKGIGLSNWYIASINKTDVKNKNRYIAEAKMNRALLYFWGLSLFGNIPYVDTYEPGSVVLPAQQTQPFVYEKIVAEINAAIPDLSDDRAPERWNKWGAYTLLARVYLNARIFKSESANAASWGAPEWDKCIEACDQVINSGKYMLEPDYFANFTYDNENSKENIFTIPFDASLATGLYIAVTHLHYNMPPKYGLSAGAWNGAVIAPDFFHSFDTDDSRFKNGITYGLQTLPDGTPIKDRDGKNLVLKPDGFGLRTAKDSDGARLTKFKYEKGGGFNMNNDYPVLRLADAFMMKAECLFRKGDATGAAELINKIRSRCFEPDKPLAVADLTEDRLLIEMRQEFFGEMRARMDLRRFDKLSKGSRTFKEPFQTNDQDILPIPQSVLRANSNLKQNPGSYYSAMN